MKRVLHTRFSLTSLTPDVQIINTLKFRFQFNAEPHFQNIPKINNDTASPASMNGLPPPFPKTLTDKADVSATLRQLSRLSTPTSRAVPPSHSPSVSPFHRPSVPSSHHLSIPPSCRPTVAPLRRHIGTLVSTPLHHRPDVSPLVQKR